jgi:hypothetical protein
LTSSIAASGSASPVARVATPPIIRPLPVGAFLGPVAECASNSVSAWPM